jgi:hypothetical protein
MLFRLWSRSGIPSCKEFEIQRTSSSNGMSLNLIKFEQVVSLRTNQCLTRHPWWLQLELDIKYALLLRLGANPNIRSEMVRHRHPG